MPPGSGQCPFRVNDHFADCSREIVNSSAWDDNGVSASVRFLSDSQKLATLIFPEFNVKMLSLDLQLFRLNDVIHLQNPGESRLARRPNGSTNFT